MKIRTSMYWIVFTLVIFPFLFFTLIITHIYSGRLEKVIIESLRVVADTQIAEMENFCEQQRNYLTMIGSSDLSCAAMTGELDDDMLQYLNNMLYSHVSQSAYVDSIALVDKESRVAACSMEYDYLAKQGMDFLIERLGEDDFFISDVMHDEQGNKTLVAVAKIKTNDELLGYALAQINLDFYKNIREQAELWNDSTFYLLDGQMEIISAGTPNEGRDSFITTQQEREDYDRKYNAIDFEKNPRGNFQYKVADRDYITYYSDITYTSWRIMLSVNMNHYKAEHSIYLMLATTLVLLCAVLAIWIGWFASKRIVLPIKRISDILKEIQNRQDYSLRIAVKQKDELGNLAIGVNELIDYIETENLYKAQQQRLLQQKAEQDALTKVLNKERIVQYLQDELERHRMEHSTLAVLFVDVDDFKAFNTKYGHGVGDQVLLFLTSLLSKETGGTVGRVGGDEFLVVVEEAENMKMLETCLEQFCSLAQNRFIVRGSEVHLPVSCCIGAVWVDFSATDTTLPTVEELINMADCAMYQVKRNGKHGYEIWDFMERI